MRILWLGLVWPLIVMLIGFLFHFYVDIFSITRK